jgi:hypothetical protein
MNPNFFGEKGLTSTSANHIADLAKEYVRNRMAALDKLNFVTTTISLIGSSDETVINKGVNSLDKIPKIIADIAEAKSLIAWLREAIKYRNKMVQDLDRLTVKEYCKQVGLEYPEPKLDESLLTEEEYFDSLSIKDRNKYYYLQTQAAVLGQYIHPDGKYAEAREELQDAVITPCKVQENGRDTLVYHYVPSVSIDDVEKQYFELQKKHREYQAQLNVMKFECEKAIQDVRAKALANNSKYNEEFRAKVNEINCSYNSYVQGRKEYIQSLKIVIPDDLKNIYTQINSLGKDK